MSKNPTWESGEPSEAPLKLGLADWLRILGRGILLAALTTVGLILSLGLRLVERPIHGAKRPWTPTITMFVCRNAFRILGMQYREFGRPMDHPGGIVANHSSWLDIFALNANAAIYFVAKSEVARWPFIGWLARATGTVFIRRSARDAAAQKTIFGDRLGQGHKLLFFPEGTSTDGLRILPFKPTLFAAFFDEGIRKSSFIQPVTVIYRAPENEDPRFYGWWGDMSFGTHLVKTLAASKQGSVDVHWHEPQKISSFSDRKSLAAAMEAAVRSSHDLAKS